MVLLAQNFLQVASLNSITRKDSVLPDAFFTSSKFLDKKVARQFKCWTCDKAKKFQYWEKKHCCKKSYFYSSTFIMLKRALVAFRAIVKGMI